VAAGAIALIAGADASLATRLALGMLGLQFAIGTANDLADAPLDALNRPGKPLPAGLVGPLGADAVLFVAAGAGLLSAASAGPAALAVGSWGLRTGSCTTCASRGPRFPGCPFAGGVALLPVYAWLGAAGTCPGRSGESSPLALLAGAVLAVANALADLDRDTEAGVVSIATILGRDRAIAADAAGLALLLVVVVLSSAAAGFVGAALPVELAAAGWGWSDSG